MRVVAVVEGADIDVVDVEQQPAAGAARELGQKLPFRHFGIVELHIGRDIFQHDGAAEEILHQLHAADDVVERFLGVGDRQQIMQVLAVHAGPAQMVRHPFRLDAAREILQALQIFEIRRRGGGDRQRHAVHHHRIALADLVEHAQRLAARQHVIFADDLEPVDRRIAVQDFVVMLVAQARDRSRGRAAWPMSTGRSASAAAEESGNLLATFMSSPLHGTANAGRVSHDASNYHGTGPGLHRAPIRTVESGRRELALGGVALFLGHGREALALAGVLALAGIRRRPCRRSGPCRRWRRRTCLRRRHRSRSTWWRRPGTGWRRRRQWRHRTWTSSSWVSPPKKC